MVYVNKFVFNPWQENTFLLYDDTGEAVIIDPGCWNDGEFQQVLRFLEEKKLKLVKVLNTHMHIDHIFGTSFFENHFGLSPEGHQADFFLVERAEEYGPQLGITLREKPASPQKAIEEGDEISFGNSTLEVLHVPGHSPGSLVFYCREEVFIVAGDVLFRGGIGRTDLWGGDMNTLLQGIRDKLLNLPGQTKVYCGHGPETTIEEERLHNQFLQGF